MSKGYHGPKADAAVMPALPIGNYKVVFVPHNGSAVPDEVKNYCTQLVDKDKKPLGMYETQPMHTNEVPNACCKEFVRQLDVGKYHDSRGRFMVHKLASQFGITVYPIQH